jgi:cytochrome c biogenesis protein CcmG/thiol:disulfide interchange protein DsbE
LLLFLVLVVFLAAGLRLNPREVPSPLIGRPAPGFEAPYLKPDPKADASRSGELFSPQSLAGQVWVLNVWASWCAPCREEHPLLMELQRQQVAPIVGLNYKDQSATALSLLARTGNPYQYAVSDATGRIGMDYGVYGVPETYVIDRQGVIRLKHTGALRAEDLKNTVLPLIAALKKS